MHNSVLRNAGPRSDHDNLTTTQDWSLDVLVSLGPRFRRVPRISATLELSELLRQVLDHEVAGIPLIIEGWETRSEWPKELFDLNWLQANHGAQVLEARNIHGDRIDRHLPLSELVDLARAAPPFATKDETERLYGKDMECPPEWRDWLAKIFMFDSIRPHGHTDVLSTSVQTLMCYLGISDTFTPCHKDLCGSTGQNLMCYTENGGSSFWFMTESSVAPTVSKYFHGLGHELDWESHVTTITEFANAPFDVYIAEQKLGDLVIVPPRSCHQVVNQGGITIKTSWSRMTIRGLEIAVYHELPIYRRVCRPEVYRVKYTIYQTMLKRLAMLEEERERYTRCTAAHASISDAPATLVGDKIQGLSADLGKLVELFDEVLQQEYCQGHEDLPHLAAEHSGSTCDFCGADIFQSFFHCTACGSHSDDSHQASSESIIICSGCFVEGRTCKCGDMKIGQCGKFSALLHNRNKAATVLQDVHRAGLSNTDANIVADGFYVANGIPVSDAARRLCNNHQRYKTARKVTRACTLRGQQSPSHPVPYASSLNCKKCHASKCFEHILELGIHVSEAILLHSIDDDNEFWHRQHSIGRAAYERASRDLSHAISSGTPWKLGDRLVYAAINFSTAKPIHENISLGFYDKPSLTTSSERWETSISGVHPSLENVDVPMVLEEEESSLPKGEKRKGREVIDCVLIIRKPKKGLKRLGISASTGPNKRVKLAPSTNSLDGSPIEEPLFVPSPRTSVEGDDRDQENVKSVRKPTQPGARLQRALSPSSSSSYSQVLSPSSEDEDVRNRRNVTAYRRPGPKPGPKFVKKPVPASASSRIPKFAHGSRADGNPVATGSRPLASQSGSSGRFADLHSLYDNRFADQGEHISGLQKQLHQQGHLLKLTRDKLKLTEDRVSRLGTDLRKSQDNYKELQTELQYQAERTQSSEFVDSILQGSRWWHSQVEGQKREVERYVQGQLRLERQRQQESIREIVEDAIKAIGPTSQAASPAALLGAVQTIMMAGAQTTTTSAVGRVMPPPSITDHRDGGRPLSQLPSTPFRNATPGLISRISVGTDEYEPREGQRYAAEGVNNRQMLPPHDVGYNDDGRYDHRPTPDLEEGSRTHRPPLSDMEGGHVRTPSSYKAGHGDHSQMADPRREAGPSNLSRVGRTDFREHEPSYRPRDPRRLRKNERSEESQAGRSLINRIQPPVPYDPYDGTELSLQYPPEEEMDTNRYPLGPPMDPRKR